MIINTTIDPQALIALLSTDRPLTVGQLDALKAEIATDPTVRGYGGKTAGDVLQLLSLAYSVPNPKPQTRGPLQSIDPIAMGKVVDRLTLKYSDTPDILAKIVPPLKAAVSLPPDDPDVVARLEQLVAGGFLSQDQVEDLVSAPDPYWQPTVPALSRCEALFGSGAALTLSDLAAVGIQ